ncbi:hypothetical protein [Variovorax sp. KK3]|uniref:hypothetical protein n=1 Tax=Variovorax sp. KK3 TaxID=1855728 RepID=UPI003569DE7A
MVAELQFQAGMLERPLRPAPFGIAGEHPPIGQRKKSGVKPKFTIKVNRHCRQNVFRGSKPAFQRA